MSDDTTVFTTHTPVPAGHDVFPFSLMEKYFHTYWPALGLDRDRFLQLGTHPKDPGAGFNMTAFSLRMSQYHNGVSKRHGEVSRRMWQSLWPDLPEDSVPIDHITNGVHLPTWIEPKIQLLFNKYLGPDWIDDHDNPLVWEMLDKIPDNELWQTHYWMKIKLIDAIRERSRKRWTTDLVSPSIAMSGGALLDPSVLTLGFARRFATYKRADLIFNDVDRLKKLLNDRWRPIQIIFAGKAHPSDDPGKRILQRIFNATRDPEMGGRIAFIEDYGEQLAQYLIHGVDVWLNNPIPPMEASGTSGMKSAMNGVPHLSLMDGWWEEGFNGKNGWTFGHEEVKGDRDQADAKAIYHILEKEVIPLYYKISEDGVPKEWVEIMKASIKSCAPKFSARRMVKEYIEKFYLKGLKVFSETKRKGGNVMTEKILSKKIKKRRVTFTLNLPDAEKVILTGDFNQWNEKKHPMKKNEMGVWKKDVIIPVGRYEYKFLVDGHWRMDPTNKETCANRFGSMNNVMVIRD